MSPRPEIIPTVPLAPVGPFLGEHLHYAATARCSCGAGLAYPEGSLPSGEWACSAELLGAPVGTGHERFSFVYYSIKGESQPSANGATTRPPEQGIVRTLTTASCSCGTEWASPPHSTAENWRPGPCPGCGNANGAGLMSEFKPGMPRPISTRSRTVLLRGDTVVEITRKAP